MRNAHFVLGLLLLSTAGCQRYLVATPNVLRDTNAYALFEACPNDCRSPDVPVLYATDRAVSHTVDEQPRYGAGRSTHLAFGLAQVSLSPNATWRELIRDSTTAKRARQHEVRLAQIQEMGALRTPGDCTPDCDAPLRLLAWREAEERQSAAHFQEMLRARLAQTPQKDVFIFVHGFNSTFEDSVFRAAEVWHFMGRVGVPVAYSWPAGHGGIRGYAYDRESGEFTVSHLRRFIKLVADSPDVERVHLIAHSRGVEVTAAALRELHIGYRAQNVSTQRALKLENLVLAAPDIDEEIFMQRFVAEHMLSTAKRTTIYASAHDKAIELADVVFASRRRLGMLGAKDFSPKMRYALARMPNVQFVECKVSGLLMSHNYVFTHPAALSDLILVLRDRRPPGAAHGRPLHQPAEGLWELTDDYLLLTDMRR